MLTTFQLFNVAVLKRKIRINCYTMLLLEIINQGCINIKRIITTRSLMFILLVEVEIKV